MGMHSVQHKNALLRGRNFIREDFTQSMKTMEDGLQGRVLPSAMGASEPVDIILCQILES